MTSNDNHNDEINNTEPNTKKLFNGFYILSHFAPGYYRHPNRIMNLENASVTLHRTFNKQGSEIIIAFTPDGEPVGILTDRDANECLSMLQYFESAVVFSSSSDTKGRDAHMTIWAKYNLSLPPKDVEPLPRSYISEQTRRFRDIADKEELQLRKSKKFADYFEEVREQERFDREFDAEIERELENDIPSKWYWLGVGLGGGL